MSLDKKLRQGDRLTDRLAKSHEKELLLAYKKGLTEIRGKLALLYEKHSKDGKLAREEVMAYNRLANLEKEIVAIISQTNAAERRITAKAIKGVYEGSFYRTAFALETTVQAKLRFGLLPTKQVEAAVLSPLDRIGWPDRSKENARLAARQIREEIMQGIIQGKPYADTAQAVAERTNMAATRATRIIQTETHRAQQVGRLDALLHAEEQGVQMVKVWTSTLDGKTRDTHQDLDGQKVGLEEEFEIHGLAAQYPGGFGDPAEDVNCRCSIRAEIVGYEPKLRRARGEGIIPYTTYNDWYSARITK